MSSREIADVVSSRHDSVKRTIETLSSKGLITFTQTVEKGTGRPLTVYHVNEEHSYIVVAQLSPEFTAALVKRWKELETKTSPSIAQKFELELMLAKAATEMLHLSESSTLSMLQRIAEINGLSSASLPAYTVDKPIGSTFDSSEPTFSATQGLKEFNAGISASAFNKLLATHGIITQLTRKSSSGKEKKFWSITEHGLRYGKNLSNPRNQNETQAHWYRSTFYQLLSHTGLIQEAA
ncbi:Rha family transcriptional regulator [Vibrio sp. HA2012]|uniref:Rha family transcriptional regulator n=1 Tax=Vibrio sp. HA2012 TaxID=1971595 RepID=UPI0018E243C1|nr:Rha family transcriptional regulator [Vibrio sp. HA2012]